MTFLDFDIVKTKLRELLIELEKKISILENDVGVLKSRVLALEKMETNKRAARDEYIYSLQGEEKFSGLTDLIKKHDPNLTVFDLARSINALKKQRVEKAHDEHPLSSAEIDSILAEFISSSDQYLSQQATVVIRFLKILAEHLNEPLIIDLG